MVLDCYVPMCFEFPYFIIALSQASEFNDKIEKSLNKSSIWNALDRHYSLVLMVYY